MRFLYLLLVIAAFAGAVGIFADSACAQQNPLFQHPAGQITAQVVSCLPAQNYTHAPLTGPLQITFAPGMQIIPASLTDSTFVVMGQQSGWHRSSSLTYDSASNTITYIPAKPFFVGEAVTAVATKKIMYDTLGQQMYLHGFAWQFYGMVTRQTRATFIDTEQINTGNGVTILSGLTDMNNSGNIDILYERSPADIIAFNSGDGINYQNTILNIAGSMFPADYHLRGIKDLVVGFNNCTFDSNQGNHTFNYGITQPFNALSEFNQLADLTYDGIPELITEGQVNGIQGEYDSINVYSVVHDSIIERQSIYVGSISVITTGDFNNDGAIDVCANANGNLMILYNDGTGNLLPPQTILQNANGWTAADMDNDDLLDLAGAIIGLGVEIDHNNGDGTFTAVQSLNSNIPFSKQTVSYNFNVADCNGDGLMDAVLTPVDLQTDSMFVVTEKNVENNSLIVNQIIPEGPNLGQHTQIHLADMFHTGALDAVIAFEEAGSISIFHNDSSVAPLTIMQNRTITPDGYILNETFPNPVSNVATVSYTVPSVQSITISIYNAIGQLVTTLVNGLVNEGTYSVTYDCTQLASGSYYVQLHNAIASLSQQFTITH